MTSDSTVDFGFRIASQIERSDRLGSGIRISDLDLASLETFNLLAHLHSKFANWFHYKPLEAPSVKGFQMLFKWRSLRWTSSSAELWRSFISPKIWVSNAWRASILLMKHFSNFAKVQATCFFSFRLSENSFLRSSLLWIGTLDQDFRCSLNIVQWCGPNRLENYNFNLPHSLD